MKILSLVYDSLSFSYYRSCPSKMGFIKMGASTTKYSYWERDHLAKCISLKMLSQKRRLLGKQVDVSTCIDHFTCLHWVSP